MWVESKKPLHLMLQAREMCGGSPSIGWIVLDKERPKIKQRLKIKFLKNEEI
jgi:hypothetical protein